MELTPVGKACKGIIYLFYENVTIPIVAQYVGTRERSGVWKQSHIDNFVITQYPLCRTKITIQQTDLDKYPGLEEIFKGSHECSCDAAPGTDEEKLYWPFTVEIFDDTGEKFNFAIYLANSVDDDGQILADYPT